MDSGDTTADDLEAEASEAEEGPQTKSSRPDLAYGSPGGLSPGEIKDEPVKSAGA
jgi:hypothetical protein